MRITRNYMSALMTANKNGVGKRRSSSLLSSKSGRSSYSKRLGSVTGSEAQSVYRNMKSNAGQLQSAASGLVNTGNGSIYDKAAESGDTTGITAKVKEFVNSYNSTVRSLKSGSSRVDTSYLNQLNAYAKMHRSALRTTGVSQNSDGTLSVDDSVLQKASVSQLKQTYGTSSSFAAKAGQTAVNVQYSAVSSMNSLINNSYSSLLRGFGSSGNFFNFWS